MAIAAPPPPSSARSAGSEPVRARLLPPEVVAVIERIELDVVVAPPVVGVVTVGLGDGEGD